MPPEDIDDDDDDSPNVPEERPDEGEDGAPPVISEIVQAPSRKPAADPFQLKPEQKERARQTIAIVASEGAKKLTREEKITALKHLRRKPNLTSQERKAAIKIFRTFKLDPAFAEQEKPKREKVLVQLFEDGIIGNAVKKWGLLTQEEKLAALDRAVDIYAAIFEIEKPKVKLKKLGLPGAQYDQLTNIITIDLRKTEEEFPALDTFSKIIHEATHAQQRQLAKEFLSGKIKPADPRWLQAQIFALNEGQLYIRPTEANLLLEGPDYRRQPVEKHAKVLADQVRVKLFELRN